MRILVAERLRPYSHRPGALCIIPGTTFALQPFPTRLRFYDLLTSEPELLVDLPLELTGPVREFTVQVDLEKGHVVVWGHTPTGFFRYHIARMKTEEKIGIYVEKAPTDNLIPSLTHPGIAFPVTYDVLWHAPSGPRLSLGNSKAQEWDLVQRRLDLKEILPLWYRAGSLTPSLSTRGKGETLDLLDECKKAVEERNTLKVTQTLTHLFLVGFKGILIPRLSDEEFQGLTTSGLYLQGHALAILSEGYEVIHNLFFQQTENVIRILPVLPGKFPSGRFVAVSCGAMGEVDFDWSKGRLRKMIFRSKVNGPVKFEVQSDLKRCRLRKSENDRGKWIACGTVLEAKTEDIFLFDNFER